MDYVLIKDGAVAAYPYGIDRMRQDNPNISFGVGMSDAALAEEFGVHRVTLTDAPAASPIERVDLADPEIIDGVWTQRWATTPLPLAEAKDALLTALADLRWRRETAGVVVGGVMVKTDRESQALLTGAYLQASRNPAFAVRYKVAKGQHIAIDAAGILAVGDAAVAHVQGCFAREGDLAGEIMAAKSVTALSKIDIAAGWPGNGG